MYVFFQKNFYFVLLTSKEEIFVEKIFTEFNLMILDVNIEIFNAAKLVKFFDFENLP